MTKPMNRTVPGIHSATEALKTRPEAVEILWIREGKVNNELVAVLDFAHQKKIKVQRVSDKKLDHEVATHQGIIAFVKDSPSWPDAKRLREAKRCLILMCDSLEDPHNVGSLMRTCWNLGATGVVFNKDHSAVNAPSAQKVACGAFEHVPVLEVSNLGAELKSLKDLGFWAYGLDAAATKSVGDVKLADKTILVVGSEEKGLRKPTLEACDELVSIPIQVKAESLNASIAGAIAIYEYKRQMQYQKI
jgi:23S rRNA (guanosine2251-2'-O)-methyltransferase